MMDTEYLESFRAVLEADCSGEALSGSYRELDGRLALLEREAPNRALHDYFAELHGAVAAYHDGYSGVERRYSALLEGLDERCEPGNIHRGVQAATPLGMAAYGFIAGLAGGPLVAVLSAGLGIVAGYLTDMYVVDGVGTAALKATERAKLAAVESEHRPRVEGKVAEGRRLLEAFEEAYYFDAPKPAGGS
jgi:hypothetical protein